MAETSTKSHEETTAAEEKTHATPLAVSERNLPSYSSDYTDVPGKNKLQTTKNRRKSVRSDLTKKTNTIYQYLESRKNSKSIELARTQLCRPWGQVTENPEQFQAL